MNNNIKKKLAQTTIAALLLGTLAIVPVSAYHITPVLDGSGAAACAGVPPPGLTSGDWCRPINNLIVCESEGAIDDRNAPAGMLTPPGMLGLGGLCTTGRNGATGVAAPPAAGPAPLPGDVTRLDACVLTVAERGGGAGACVSSNAAEAAICAANPPATVYGLFNPAGTADCTDAIAWSFRIGTTSCAIPTTGTTRTGQVGAGPPADAGNNLMIDFAAYYEELYAWWSYDGDGSYTVGIAPDGIPNNDPDGTPGSNGAPSNGNAPVLPALALPSDDVSAQHGHAAMFVATAATAPAPARNFGSATAVAFPRLAGPDAILGTADDISGWVAAGAFSQARYAGYGTPAIPSGWAAAGGAAFPAAPPPMIWDDGINTAGNVVVPGPTAFPPFPTGFSNNCAGYPSEDAEEFAQGAAAFGTYTAGGMPDPAGPMVRAP